MTGSKITVTALLLVFCFAAFGAVYSTSATTANTEQRDIKPDMHKTRLSNEDFRRLVALP